MAKESRHVKNWVEVAPGAMVRPRRYAKKLETIVEEIEYYDYDKKNMKMDVHVPKRVVYALPLFISLVLYFLLSRYFDA